MTLQHTVKALLRKGEHYYVAECVEIAVVTQGRTVDETLANLQEAIALHLEGENPADFGLVSHPTILVTMELEPAGAQAYSAARNLGYTFGRAASFAGKALALAGTRRKPSALPAGPTERGGPPPLLGLSPGLCGPR